MINYTPGPWTVEIPADRAFFKSSATGELVLISDDECKIRPDDAALVAAAPEMLKALNSIFLKCSFEHVRDWQQFRREVGELAGVAIAELEGIE